MRRPPVVLLFVLLAASCSPARHDAPWTDVREVTPAFLADTRATDPSLAIDARGQVALTWVTRDSTGADAWLTVSADSGAHWTTPVRLNPTAGTVASYTESRPITAWGEHGVLVAAWAARRDTTPGVDDVAARVSLDGGRTWGAMARVNDDHANPRSGYHGFAAANVLPDGRPAVAWIDGRGAVGQGDEPERAEIYLSTTRDGGVTWSPNVWVADQVCACCRIALKSTVGEHGGVDVAVAYRGALDDLRDPRLAVSNDGGQWFELDTLVAADHWKLPGCPSVGPALSIGPGGGHYAWYTGETPDDATLPGRPAPGVYLVPWRADRGTAGPKRMLSDSLHDASRPMLASLAGGTLVAAIGESADRPRRKVLALRRLDAGGTLSPWLYVGSGVKSGAIAGQGERGAWAAWSEASETGTRVRVARLTGR